MKIFFGLLFTSILTFNLYSQTLENQLKVIFGNVLISSKYKELRVIGKAVRTSGLMQYEIEKLKAYNDYNINYNTEGVETLTTTTKTTQSNNNDDSPSYIKLQQNV